jgi:tRNA_anti-like
MTVTSPMPQGPRPHRIGPLLLCLIAVGLVALIGIGLFREGVATQQDFAEREALIERNKKIQEDADRKNAVAQEAAVANFSPAAYAITLDSIDRLIKQKQWVAAKQNLDVTFRDVQRVVNSHRGKEKGVVSVAERLNRQERTILAGLRDLKDKEDEANSLSSVAMFRDFEDNEIRANQTYKNKRVRVRGPIESIGTDILGTPYVALAGSSVFTVQAMFPRGSESRLASLSKGQTVVVNCRCEGKLMNVILRDCSIE